MELQKFIQKYTNTSTPKTDEQTFFGSGVAEDVLAVTRDLPEGFTEHEPWCDSAYRKHWLCHERFIDISYCEGDVFVYMCKDHKTWSRHIDSANAFYKEH